MVIFQIAHYVKPEFIEAYQAAVREDAKNSVLEEGILRFEVFQDQAYPAHFTLLEVYRDRAAREFHLQTPYLLKFRNTVVGQEMLARKEEREFDLFFPEKINK